MNWLFQTAMDRKLRLELFPTGLFFVKLHFSTFSEFALLAFVILRVIFSQVYAEMLNFVKILFSDSLKICCNHCHIQTKRFYQRVL